MGGLIRVSSLKLSPKRLFRSKKEHSLRYRSETSSFSHASSSYDASSSVHRKGSAHLETGTDTSVLPDVKLSRKQLEALLCRLGSEPPSQDEMTMMLREVGCHDGDEACVNVEAFLGRVGSVCGQECDAVELKETFDFFDVDRDGRITAEELLRVFTTLGDERCSLEDCRRMIAEVDKNRDGFVCFEDFALMMDLQTG